MKIEDFDYELPKELIAQYPSTKREESRLMVLNRKTQGIEHTKFGNIGDYLKTGDTLVLNETKVIPARLIGSRDTGGKVEVFLLKELSPGRWEVLVSPHRAKKSGLIIRFGPDFEGKVEINNGKTNFIFSDIENLEGKLEKYGRVPLPPYIKRETVLEDKERYQTVYAKIPGACAAPTAGLHFTQEILDKLSSNGITVTKILLHTGIGTFKPIKCEEIETHKMETEYYEVSEKAIQEIKKANRIVAVGTTTVRTLENLDLSLESSKGWTDKFIYPPYKFKLVDALITNFHLPRSTLLLLVSAFAGREFILKAYETAIEQGYRFYSYGDAMLIL